MQLVREIEALIANAAGKFESSVTRSGTVQNELEALRSAVISCTESSSAIAKLDPSANRGPQIVAALACCSALALGLQQELVNVSKAVSGGSELPQETRHRCVDFWARVQSHRALLVRTLEAVLAGEGAQSARARLEALLVGIEEVLLDLHREFGRLAQLKAADSRHSTILPNSAEVLGAASSVLRMTEFSAIQGAVGGQIAELAG